MLVKIQTDISTKLTDLHVYEQMLVNATMKNGAGFVKVIFDTNEKARNEKKAKEKKSHEAGGILGIAEMTLHERNADYKKAYQKAGSILKQYFPDGVALKTEGDFQRFVQFLMCTSKMNRYSENLSSGGHFDSALDLINFAAFLAEASQEK